MQNLTISAYKLFAELDVCPYCRAVTHQANDTLITVTLEHLFSGGD